MNQRHSTDRPVWVGVVLWGVPDRATAVAMQWVGLAAMLVAPALWLGMQPLGEVRSWVAAGLVGVFFFACRGIFGSAIRWMDEHGGWPHG